MTGPAEHALTRATPRDATLFASLMLLVAACSDPPPGTDPFLIRIVSAAPLTFTSTAASAIVNVRPAACGPWDYGSCGSRFEPNVTDIAPGGSVVWRWDSDACDVTFEDDPEPPASAPVRASGTHTRTFDSPGRYRYRCRDHSDGFFAGMVGVVNVR